MKIVLVNGSLRGGAYNHVFGVSIPPLGLVSLAGAIKSQGHEAVLLDASAKRLRIKETIAF